MVRIAVAILALGTIIAGFFIVGTPAQARLARFDAQKVMDLQGIQGQIIYYWQAKQKLPVTLADLNNTLSYGSVPVDPQTNEAYGYKATGALSFEICGDFNTVGGGSQLYPYESRSVIPTQPMSEKGISQDNWAHGSGTVCFDRTIDPSFYPPLSKVQP